MDICLTLNGTEIPLTRGSYSESREYIDNKNVTEAGSTVRELVRAGIISLSVSLTCDSETKQILDGFADEASLEIQYWSEKDATVKTLDGYLDGYKADLITDSSERFYDVSFNVKEL